MEKQEIIKTALRVPQSLHQRIHAAARIAGRSFNAEIVYQMSRIHEDSQGVNRIHTPGGVQQ